MRDFFALGLVFLGTITGAHAQFLQFSRTTDTVQISGSTVVGPQATFEANVKVTAAAQGSIWNEWANGVEDKALGITSSGTYGFTFGGSTHDPFTGPGLVVDGNWHHVAYVCDGAQDRLYLDGALIATEAADPTIHNGSSTAHQLGAIFRDSFLHSSFQGIIDSLRISSVARYSGASFVPPVGDMVNDANTQLLYNFNERHDSTTVVDLSGHGHNGVLGVGFGGATSPVFGGLNVAPTGFSLFRGILAGGGLADLVSSDDSYLFLRPGAVLNSSEAPVQVVVDGTSPSATVGELRITVEAAVGGPNIHQYIDLFNYVTNGWETVADQPATLSDSVETALILDNPNRFIQAQTNHVRCRVRAKAVGPLLSYPWLYRIDQVGWSIPTS